MDTWHNKYSIVTDLKFIRSCFKNINEISKVTKLKDFQYRLLHNKIFCNDILVGLLIPGDGCDRGTTLCSQSGHAHETSKSYVLMPKLII